MSFIYSQALGGGFLADNCLDTDASVPSSGNPTPRPCLWHDKTMEPSRLSRFGMTCKPLTAEHGAALLTSFVADSRARTSVWQAKARALTVRAAACGTTWPASLARFDPATHSLKIAQLSLLEDLTGCCVTLPRSGLMLDGQLWELPTLGRHTSASESGFWQTPVADDCVNRAAEKFNSRGEPKLSAQVMVWPTPTAQDAEQAGGMGCIAKGKRGLSLHQAIQQFPTPVRSDYKSGSFSQTGKDRRQSQSRGKPLNETIGGQLNPDLVEWLMGWPIGQTALKPLETGRFQEWQQQHSIC